MESNLDEEFERNAPDPEFVKNERKLKIAKLVVQIVGIIISLALVAVIGVIILKNGVGKSVVNSDNMSNYVVSCPINYYDTLA